MSTAARRYRRQRSATTSKAVGAFAFLCLFLSLFEELCFTAFFSDSDDGDEHVPIEARERSIHAVCSMCICTGVARPTTFAIDALQVARSL